MRKCIWLAVLLSMIIPFAGIARIRADILPARGEGQIGYQAVVADVETSRSLDRIGGALIRFQNTRPWFRRLRMPESKLTDGRFCKRNPQINGATVMVKVLCQAVLCPNHYAFTSHSMSSEINHHGRSASGMPLCSAQLLSCFSTNAAFSLRIKPTVL